jgi:hypothetical protein
MKTAFFFCSDEPLNVQILHIECVVFDELAARLNAIAHQYREESVGLDRVFDLHLEHRAFFRDPLSSRKVRIS